jgi:cytochrome d ubiquinol oxidase subunit II
MIVLLPGAAAPVVSAVAGVATLVLLVRRAYPAARLTAVAAVSSVVAGWGAGQYPWLLVDEVRIREAGGAPATLQALLVVVGLAAVIVLPALAHLFRLTQTESWSRH